MGKFIAYSDCKDTQIFAFDSENLQLTKLTQKICLANEGLQSLPAALHLKLFTDPDSNEPKLLILDHSLTLHQLNLSSDFKLNSLLSLTDSDTTPKLRSYDSIPLGGLFHLNPFTQNLYLALSGPNQGLLQVSLSKRTITW